MNNGYIILIRLIEAVKKKFSTSGLASCLHCENLYVLVYLKSSIKI